MTVEVNSEENIIVGTLIIGVVILEWSEVGIIQFKGDFFFNR